MKKTIFILLLSISIDAMAEDLSGEYSCKGYDPYNKKEYNQMASIQKTDQTYTIKYSGFAGLNALFGTGIWDEKSNSLSVIYADENKKDFQGIQIYHISSDLKQLKGPWSNLNQHKVGTETCTRMEKK